MELRLSDEKTLHTRMSMLNPTIRPQAGTISILRSCSPRETTVHPFLGDKVHVGRTEIST